MLSHWTLILTIVSSWWHGVSMLKLVDLSVPNHLVRGQSVRLKCHYDLEGEALYSVKWYKDLHEFFRYLPGDDPPAQIVNLTGVNVDLRQSTDTVVFLRNVDNDGSGVYRCEVSGEAPTFQTVGESKQMVVVDLPDQSGPQIEGTRPRYGIGETLRINCTSSRSRPAAKLAWYINNEPAEEAVLRHYPIFIDEDRLETSILGLDFKVRRKHFKEGDLKLRCLATIGEIYWRSNEESVESLDRPQKAPVLESRDPFSSGAWGVGSRDPVPLLAASLIIIMFISWRS